MGQTTETITGRKKEKKSIPSVKTFSSGAYSGVVSSFVALPRARSLPVVRSPKNLYRAFGPNAPLSSDFLPFGWETGVM